MKKLWSLLVVVLVPALVVGAVLIVSNKPLEKAEQEYLTGNVYYKANELDLAIEHYAKAAALNPQHEDALNNLAVIYNQRGEYGFAAQALERLVALKPENPTYQYDFGVNLMMDIKQRGATSVEELELAKGSFQKAQELSPGYLHAEENIAFIDDLLTRYGALS